MDIKILSPQWGHEHLPLHTFLDKIRAAGYDGVDTWIPLQKNDKRLLFDYLQLHQIYMVSHQHRAVRLKNSGLRLLKTFTNVPNLHRY